ncbi:RtcB family protein [Geodermatophilus sp. DSM 45219]|uniref:RtcB family protein n=1 Tax=Geodermatophilus sp. DSM 45219 TaxID=1881103 RepID=UPI0021008C11|nr:RtcB family protein [Geodermatophilus sp. DSM 45219]
MPGTGPTRSENMEKISDRLLNWASILEPTTRVQAERTASMPFIHPHVALMPDAHLGLGATVGSVIPTDRAIIPAAVGVDIGCGMMAVRTQFTGDDVRGRDLGTLHEQVSRAVPLSAGRYNKELRETAAARVAELRDLPGVAQADGVAHNWPLQLGSLGSGNHFIEVCLDEDDRVWLFLHSGSRGVGNRLASKHIRIAQDRTKAKGVDVPDRDLAYLEEGEPEFDAYVEALHWAQRFAALNREEMMDRLAEQVSRFLTDEVQRAQVVQCHHNYTERETHYGSEVWLSRKGAISARAGQWGLIPGSMGTASYVVVGKGNVESLTSAPHGAGRAFSRTAARKRFSRADLDRRMRGIAWGRSNAFLDEHPDAYKPVDVVMADAADLVEVRHTLRQVVNVKGD